VAPDPQQTLAEGEQTLSDSDQTHSDSDQTLSDSDQTSSDCDQLAADEDQAASDRDLAHGVDTRAYEVTRDIRERTARRREETAEARAGAADSRDAIAHARDLAARARDQAAGARDLAVTRGDAPDEEIGAAAPADDGIARAAERPAGAAARRARAAEQRALAAQDRQDAAEDREQAARDRLHALADREALARQLAFTETDPLTGTRARAAGLSALDVELNRCRRTGGMLAVAYVDAVGLKAVNDTEGHAAGDALLKRVVQRIKRHLRPYDLIVRLGGDEFLCAMSNMTVLDARRRFGVISVALAAAPHADAIRTGFAQLRPNETAAELIERADNELIDTHHDTHDGPPQPTVDGSADRPR
jgi:diguanylate cyclase (GGDEF)-like protein